MTGNIKNPYAVAKCLRRRAVSTHSAAIGFSHLNVVWLLSSVSVIWSNNLAMHSSANELLTTFTPVKSRTTRSFWSIIGNRLSRTRCPKGRVRYHNCQLNHAAGRICATWNCFLSQRLFIRFTNQVRWLITWIHWVLMFISFQSIPITATWGIPTQETKRRASTME